MDSTKKKFMETKSKLAEQVQVVETIEAKIEAAKLELASLGPSQTEALRLKREDRLADFALGQANRSEIEKLDEIIAAESAKDQKREEIKGSISGLSRKMEEAQGAKQAQGWKYREAALDTLEDEAQEIAAEYMAAALKVCSTFRRLMAVTTLHAELHNDQNQFGLGQSAARFLSIPAFRHLAAFEGNAGPDLTSIIAAQDIRDNSGGLFQNDVEAERARLLEDGVDLAKAR